MSNCNNSANSQLKAMQARLDRIDDDLIAHYAGISELVLGLSLNPVTAPNVVKSLRTYNFNPLGQRFLKSLLRLIPGYETFKRLQHLEAAGMLENMGEKLAGYAEHMAETAVLEQAAALTAKVEALAERTAAIVASGIPYLQELQATIDLVNSVTAEEGRQMAIDRAEQKLTEAVADGLGAAQIAELQSTLDLARSVSATDGHKMAIAWAEQELVEAIANGVGGPAMQALQAASDRASSNIQKLEKAVNAIIDFITTMNDVADCRTRSQILR